MDLDEISQTRERLEPAECLEIYLKALRAARQNDIARIKHESRERQMDNFVGTFQAMCRAMSLV